MRQSLVQVIAAADASVNETSVVLDCTNVTSLAGVAISTGSSTGSIQMQVSCDPPELLVSSLGVPVPVNWVSLGSALTITAASTFLLPRVDMTFKWARFVYTKNNGSTGTITLNIMTLGF